jgi:hypothetical protein
MEAAAKRADLGMVLISRYLFSGEIVPSQQKTAMNMIQLGRVIFQGMRSQS